MWISKLSALLLLAEVSGYLSGSALLGITQGIVQMPFYAVLTLHEVVGATAGILGVILLIASIRNFLALSLSVGALESLALAGYSGILYLETGKLVMIFSMALLNVISVALTSVLLGLSLSRKSRLPEGN